MSCSPPSRAFELSRLSRAIVLCSCAAAGTSQAQEAAGSLVLEPSVISGSRSAAQSFDLPFSVDSIDREQISDGQLGINASEVLTRVPGLVVQNRQNYAQDLQISSRGFGARSAFGVRGLKLITDGIPASTPDGQGQAATFNLDTADRIEVLRGPASTLYGSNAGGVIQVFSRDGVGRPRIGAETLVGSDGLTRNHLTAEGEADGVGFVLDASRMDTDGYRDHSSARRDQTFAKLNFKPDEDSKLALIYSSLEQNGTQDPLGQTWEAYKADPRSVTANALAYNTRKSIDHQQLGTNYERYFGDATFQLTAYVGKRSVTQYLSIPKYTPSGTLTPSNNLRGGGVVDFDREFHGGSVRWLQPIDAVAGTLQLVFGLDYDQSRDDRRGYQNYVGDQLGNKGELRRDEIDTMTSLDPYAQATWAIGNWTLQGGLRYSTVEVDIDDKYITATNLDESGNKRFSKATPSFSVGYAFTPDLNGYVSVGKGFETPTQGELAYSPGAAGVGVNYGLRPSESTQYEIGLKARIAQATRINAAIFQINTDDEIVVAGSNGGRTSYQNAGKTLRRGFELGVDSQLTEQWSAALAYTYLAATYDSRFAAGNNVIDKGNNLPGVPRTTLFGELAWKPVDGISTALEGLYRSKVYVEDTNTERAAPSYAVFNWRTRFEQNFGPWKTHQTLRLDNLADKQYVGSVIVGDGNGRFYEAAPGRSWYAGAGIEYQF
ncbi:TonB-dependent receptor [Pseudomonas sp. PA27(2017)]|uniref:TonB-dependent receptor family protein n=1 Tax=Pseudomonas sp. PA27(2017) TaxID=1932112 RepID=UPI000968E76B|nr:TonB-dependent receptor [Pseudomonas sp. PA27(2017)]OLU33339.1 TonB-dependent siderophore receptor [Pseudomonas sp. PA27(2017)]